MSGPSQQFNEYQRLIESLLADNRTRIEVVRKELADDISKVRDEVNKVRREDVGSLRTQLAVLTVKMTAIVSAAVVGLQVITHFVIKWINGF